MWDAFGWIILLTVFSVVWLAFVGVLATAIIDAFIFVFGGLRKAARGNK